jgi:glycosyltransferase involved in cell wall biosynthesis
VTFPRVALVSTGLGRVRRGFESFTESLFAQLRRACPECEVVLFQGGGQAAEQRRVVLNLHRGDIPARWFRPERASLIEKRSFALTLYPKLLKGDFDIVHYNELTMGSALCHLRRYLGGRFRLLYCNGAPSPPIHFHNRCDLAQILTGPMLDDARAFGMSEDQLALVPYGVDTDRFDPKCRAGRHAVLKELDIPDDAPVVLSVAAIKREHKRIDYLVEEISKLGRDVWLVVAGQRTPDTPIVAELAEKQLLGRYRFVTWPHDRMHELYGATDAFVLASVTEGLPNVMLEAMASGLPVITHHGPLFRWVAGESAVRCIDMSRSGSLANTLSKLLAGSTRSREGDSNRREVTARFSWDVLLSSYLEMYERAARPVVRMSA